MKKRFLTKCVTTMLATSLLMASLNVPVYAEEPQVIEVNEENVVESGAVGEESSDSLYSEESKETAVEPTESEESNSISEETVVEESQESSEPVESSETTASYEVIESESIEETNETDDTFETIEESETIFETIKETTTETEIVVANELSIDGVAPYAGQVVLSGNCGYVSDANFDKYKDIDIYFEEMKTISGDDFYQDNATYVLTRNADNLNKYTLKITGSGTVGRCELTTGEALDRNYRVYNNYGTSLYHAKADTTEYWNGGKLWSDYAEDITEIIVGEGIRSWQLNLYLGPGTEKHPGHTLEDGTTVRGYDSLTKITLPESLSTIYGPSFSNCPALAELTIPANVRMISGVWFGTYSDEISYIRYKNENGASNGRYAVARDNFTIKGYPATMAEVCTKKCPPPESGITTTFESIQKENEVLVLLRTLYFNTSGWGEIEVTKEKESHEYELALVRTYDELYGEFPDLNESNYGWIQYFGRDFLGWYLEPVADEGKITPEDKVSRDHATNIELGLWSLSSDENLYADVIKLYGHWGEENSKTTTTVYLDPRGGTLPDGSSTSVTFSEGDTGKWNLPTPVKEGYTFKYWYRYIEPSEYPINNDDTIGQVYFPEDKRYFPISDCRTLYAKWEKPVAETPDDPAPSEPEPTEPVEPTEPTEPADPDPDEPKEESPKEENPDRPIDADWGDVDDDDIDSYISGDLAVTGVSPDVPYTGSSIKFSGLKVYDGKILLRKGTNYSVKYSGNKNVGTATITITGKGLYKGKSSVVSFAITPLDVSNAVATNNTATYNGKTKNPNPTIKLKNKALKKNRDYTISLTSGDFTSAGVHTLTITGMGNYTGTKEISYTIADAKYLLSKASVKGVKSYTYAGQEIRQTGYTVKIGKTELVEGTDYTVSYVDNNAVGTATMIIKGIGTYSGEKVVTFSIKGIAISKAKVTYEKSFTYRGTIIKPTVSVTVNNKTLSKGADYTVTYLNNKNAGTATILLTGKGVYTGTKKVTFKINALDMSKNTSMFTVTSPETVSYTGKAVKPEVTVKYRGVTLKNGVDYTVSYANNKKVATATDKKAPTITIKGKGSFKGKLVAKFNIQ